MNKEIIQAVHAAETVMAGAKVLIQNLVAKLNNAVNSGDMQQVAALAAELSASSDDLSAAVVANTSAAAELGGTDTVAAGGGTDTITAGTGDNTVAAGAGADDSINGGQGNDAVVQEDPNQPGAAEGGAAQEPA